jgi:type IV secretory pathway ATPase VirB11/archaellum biosynthesis ATPase
MACEYELKDGALRVNCLGCVYGSSIEDFEACMATTIDKLMKNKDVERVVLAETRENEYDFEQTQLLMEIADAYNKIVNEEKLLSLDKLGPKECEKLYPKRLADIQFLVLEVLRKDPIGAYVQLKYMITREKAAASLSKNESLRECHDYYVSNSLEPMRRILESTRLIKMAQPMLKNYKMGDRRIYREIFHPVVRPNFMLTRYMVEPPKRGSLVDKYVIDESGTEVEIFKIPGKVRHRYHMIPKEFQLSEEKYMILDSARRYLSEHRPTEREVTEPELAREVFTNVGRDLIKEIARTMSVSLDAKEANELAVILSRHTAGFGVLELILRDDRIQDVYINSPIGSRPIYVLHSDFEECETNLIPTKDDAEAWATRFRLYSGRPLDEANPVLDTELIVPGGRARVAAITKTLSPEGLAFALRRHREKPWTFPLFMKAKYIDPLYAGLMSFIIDGGRACLIAGGRSSGKTSLLGSMMLEIMRKYRVIVQEDTLELPVVQMRKLGYNIARLKSRSVITKVETELPADEALRTALRLGDSVLILGEVRSTEGKALFEAMRIGALANFVAGTIHGESAYGVYDRVVNDLGVPNTSFKAIDLITICNMLNTPDGLHKFRRVTGLTEVRKHWKEDPSLEGGFVELMEYSARDDKLKPTSVLLDGESEVLNEIAKRVREWHGRWDDMWSNILLRSDMKESIFNYAERLNRPEILEAGWTIRSNEMFHIISDQVKMEVGGLDSKLIYDKWENWFKGELKSSKEPGIE